MSLLNLEAEMEDNGEVTFLLILGLYYSLLLPCLTWQIYHLLLCSFKDIKDIISKKNGVELSLSI